MDYLFTFQSLHIFDGLISDSECNELEAESSGA
jgi:hypothetical protein